MPTNNYDLASGTIYFNGEPIGTATGVEFSDYVEDEVATREYIKSSVTYDPITLTCTVRFNMITYLKVCGLWQWIIDNCPNRRLTHLMQYGKNARVRLKNYRRAIHEIDKHIH